MITKAERAKIMAWRRARSAERKEAKRKRAPILRVQQAHARARLRVFLKAREAEQELLCLEVEQARCVGSTTGKHPLPSYLRDD